MVTSIRIPTILLAARFQEKSKTMKRNSSLVGHAALILSCVSISRSPAQSTSTNCFSPPPGLISWWRAEGNGLDAQGINHFTG